MAATCYPDKNYVVYMSEVQGLRAYDAEVGDYVLVDEDGGTNDDGGQDAFFLQDIEVRLEDIVLEDDGAESSSSLFDVENILTPRQRATVKRHVDNARTTMRLRNKQQRHDVRDLFGTVSPPLASLNDGDGAPSDQQQKSVQNIFRKNPNTHSRQKHYEVPPPDYPHDDEPAANHSNKPVFEESDGGSQSKPQFAKPPQIVIACADTGCSGSLPSLTRVDDLGKKDQKLLNTLAHIELMTLFDDYNITYSRRKTNRKVNDHGVFGVPLQTLVDRDRKRSPNTRVPLIVQHLIRHLEERGLREEGLLRVPGRLSQIKELRNECNSAYGRGKSVSFESVSIHEVAGLLKLFLRELPNPLLTSERVDAFIQLDKIADPIKQLTALNLLVLILPEAHRESLLMLLGFLSKVVAESENRMSAENVAMVIAPNLFLPPTAGKLNKTPAVNIEEELQFAIVTSKVTLLLITNHILLWNVPSALMGQIRQKHEVAVQPSNPIMRLLGKEKERPESKQRTSDGGSGDPPKINVKLEHTGADTNMLIDPNTTAGDVVQYIAQSPAAHRRRVILHRKSDPPLETTLETCVLYEVGGNIGERRLDHETKMIDVCQINPNAKYVVRSRPQ